MLNDCRSYMWFSNWPPVDRRSVSRDLPGLAHSHGRCTFSPLGDPSDSKVVPKAPFLDKQPQEITEKTKKLRNQQKITEFHLICYFLEPPNLQNLCYYLVSGRILAESICSTSLSSNAVFETLFSPKCSQILFWDSLSRPFWPTWSLLGPPFNLLRAPFGHPGVPLG